MDKDQPGWQRMRFKKNKVWMATDANGKPLEKNGKVLIRYQLDQDHEYWVNKINIGPVDTPDGTVSAPSPPRPTPRKKATGGGKKSDTEVVRMFTDGAASGNPGPAGIGIVLQYGKHEKEISEYLGETTNNIAELEAIRVGLNQLKKKSLAVRIYTDSSYALGVLGRGWKAKKNRRLVDTIRKLLDKFDDLEIIKVPGHAGHKENERADRLARAAVKRRG
jgi:ribonuclease HI